MDRSPPEVVEVSPEPLAPLADLRRPVVFRFDERISERGIEGSVLVSPRTGDVLVEKGRREIRVRAAGGWAPETVYRVVLLPGVQDLFGNARTEEAELVFSTGPPIPNTAVAGLVTDRLTGRAVQGVVVEALRLADSLSWLAVTDSAGFYALRHIPPAEYRLVAFRDANRNLRLDPFEEQAGRDLVLATSDTTVVALAILAPDSTPAQLTRAAPEDSLTVRLVFDDALDPDVDLAAVRHRLVRLPDSAAVPVAGLLWPWEHAERRRAEQAARDSAAAAAAVAADTAAVDTLAPPADTAGADTLAAAPRDAPAADPPAAPPTRPPGEVPTGPDPAERLPPRELFLVVRQPLAPDAAYVVVLEAVVNVAGLPGGGGAAEFVGPTPEAASPDAAAVGDTLGVEAPPAPPDTLPPDSAARPPRSDLRAGDGSRRPPPDGVRAATPAPAGRKASP